MDNDNSDNKDEDTKEVNDDVWAITVQRNHTTRTVNRAYTNQQGASVRGV